MTAGPSAGPGSADPPFRTPASICFNEANDVFVPGLIAGTPASLVLSCASAEPIMPSWAAAKVTAVVAKKRRRWWSIESGNFLMMRIGEFRWFQGLLGVRLGA